MLTKEIFGFFPACSLLLEPAHFQFLSDFSSLLVYYILLEIGILVKCTELIMKFPSFIQFHCILVFLEENLQYQANYDGLFQDLKVKFSNQSAFSFLKASEKVLPARLLEPARVL